MIEYKIVTGEKKDFEKELNILSNNGWTYCSNMTINEGAEGVLIFSILMGLIEEKELTTVI